MRGRAAKRVHRAMAVGMVAASAFAVGACSSGGSGGAATSACPTLARERLAPTDGVLFGVNPDFGAVSLDEYADRLRLDPAVVVAFSGFPIADDDREEIDGAVRQLEPTGAALLLTLEPYEGLAAIDRGHIDDLATMLRSINDRGVPVLLRFAHEMNGSWYAWGQQPAYHEPFISSASRTR